MGVFFVLKLVLSLAAEVALCVVCFQPCAKAKASAGKELHTTKNPELVFAFKKPNSTDLKQSISLHTDEL